MSYDGGAEELFHDRYSDNATGFSMEKDPRGSWKMAGYWR